MTEPTVDPTTHVDTDGGGAMEGESVLTQPEPVETPAVEAVDTEPAATEPAPSFTIPEQFANDPRFKDVDSVEKLFEVMAAQPGAPESIEGYQASLSGLNDEAMAGFKQAALEAGLTAKQFDQVVGYYNSQSANARKMADNQLDNYVKQVHNDWGESFDANLKTAKTALRELAPRVDGLKEFMDNPFIGSHPVALRLFHAIGTMISDDAIHLGDAPGVAAKLPEQGGVKYFSTYDKSMEK